MRTVMGHETQRNRSLAVRIIFGALITSTILMMAVIFLVQAIRNERAAEQESQVNQLEIEKEFSRINHPAEANPTSRDPRFVRKAGHGLIGLTYKTNLTYAEVRAYYDAELARNGWKYQKDVDVFYRGQRSGGKEVFYSKGKLTAVLQYAGHYEQEEMGWNYGLDLSWGTHRW